MDAQFEEMSQQMAILKEKLQKQEIVNEKQMRNAIVKKLHRVTLSKWAKLLLILFALVYVPSMLHFILHFPLWYVALTAVFFATSAVWDFYFSRGISDNHLSRSQLLETSRRLVRMKKMNARWLCFSIPFLLLWLSGFYYLLTKDVNLPEDAMQGLIFGALIGLLAGGVLGTIMYLKQQRRAQDIVDQIEEFTSER